MANIPFTHLDITNGTSQVNKTNMQTLFDALRKVVAKANRGATEYLDADLLGGAAKDTGNSASTIVQRDSNKRIAASGLIFPGTQEASTDANTLDDYEEGSWTPAYSAATGAFGTIDYDSTRNGKYTKIGNIVRFSLVILTDTLDVGTASGALKISGLPFASAGQSAISVAYAYGFTGEHPSGAIVDSSTQTISLFYRSAADGALASVSQANDLMTGANANRNMLHIAGVYQV